MSEKFDPKSKVSSIQGKDYLEVKWRIVWFRQDHPKGGIVTEVINDNLIKASVIDGENHILATGHGSPKTQGVSKGRPFEGAETAAIGRALAHAGYGTQFTDEDEGDHLADVPVQKKGQPSAKVWTMQQKQALVDAKYALDLSEAKTMLDQSILKDNASIAHATSWAKHYRGARDENKDAATAAKIANDAYTAATSKGK